MIIPFDYRLVSKHTGWVFRWCPACSMPSAMRFEERWKVYELCFVPVRRKRNGEALMCEFCAERFTAEDQPVRVGIDEWKMEDGISRLAELSGVKLAAELVTVVPESCAEALLESIEKHTSIREMGVSKPRFLLGMIVGVLVGCLIGWIAAKHGWLFPYMSDMFGSIVTIALICGVTGGFLFEGCCLVRHGRKLAVRWLRKVSVMYDLDVEVIDRISQNYGARVQGAVSRFRREREGYLHLDV